jgi:general secretion pathway protein M
VSDVAPWLSRTAALLVLAVLLALVHAGLVAPYFDHVAALDDKLANRAAVLERMRALGDGEAAAPTPTTASLLLPAVSDAQAVGTLQDRLKAFAARDGLELQNLQVLPRGDLPGVARLAVRLRAVGDIGALNRFLHAVESAEPVLLVDNLRIQSRTPRPTPGAASAALDVQLDVVGFKADAS